MQKSITELKDKHKDADIWIIAAGASMDYVPPDFFKSKITIGINDVWKKYKCTYLVRKENMGLKDAINNGGSIVIAAKYDRGNSQRANSNIIETEHVYYMFDHKHNQCTAIDESVFGTDLIVVSFSTVTSGLHVAAYMGAANIIVCGHDCGCLDGKIHFDGYPMSAQPMWYGEWLPSIVPQTVLVREKLKKVYGCNMMFLTPFVGPNKEEHGYG